MIGSVSPVPLIQLGTFENLVQAGTFLNAEPNPGMFLRNPRIRCGYAAGGLGNSGSPSGRTKIGSLSPLQSGYGLEERRFRVHLGTRASSLGKRSSLLCPAKAIGGGNHLTESLLVSLREFGKARIAFEEAYEGRRANGQKD